MDALSKAFIDHNREGSSRILMSVGQSVVQPVKAVQPACLLHSSTGFPVEYKYHLLPCVDSLSQLEGKI